ncbi:unnamed protein product [Adineta steineri]|uniref:Uncharacterized protein n=1 Tax=Adineta steineri TaxID=433720 RepID=A0A818IZJ1_9BILA|nr:unnamed protein product [Adineta steineri]CAF3533095.1 unnamed protein product [Adineta steineri]
MVRLAPPPTFTLPPPPMFPSDILDMKLVFRFSCSSIRQRQHQHQQIINSRSIMFSCITFLIIILLFALLFLISKFYRIPKSSSINYKSKSLSQPLPPPSLSNMKSTNLSMNTSRSYETISSIDTGLYVNSIDTSATTYSTDPSNVIYLHCSQGHDYSTISPPPPYYHTLNIPS